MRESLRLHYRAIIALMLLPAVTAELISEATPAPDFFLPSTLFLFTFIGYGLPVLIIREFAVRCRIRIAGIFVLGLAYAIYNEGFLAKTLTMESGVPSPAFDHYSMFGGINFAWMAVICIYHAMCSVLFPILIVHTCYPESSKAPWLGKKLTCILAVTLFLVGCAAFMREEKIPGAPGQLVFFVALMGAGGAIAMRMKAGEYALRPLRKSIRPVFWGLSVLPVFLILTAIPDRKLPLLLFVAALVAIMAGYIFVMKSARYANMASLKLFGAGMYIGFTLFGSTLHIALKHDIPVPLITGVVAVSVLLWWIRRILKDEAQNGQAGALR